jgi:sugar phosphate isomerase/epimerase
MRIGYNTWSMATVPYETFIPALADIGFGAIAISVVPGYGIGGRQVPNAAALDRLCADDVRRIREAMRERDLDLPSVIGNQSLVHTDPAARKSALEMLKREVDLCVEIAVDGLPTLNTGTGGHTGQLEDPATQPMILDGLAELAEYAARAGVVVCVEPHVNGAIDTVERAEWLIQRLAHPNVRLDFDVSHFEVQDIPTEVSVSRLMPLAAAVEIKDQHCRPIASSSDSAWLVEGNGSGSCTTADGRELEFQFLLAGEGTFDLARYLRLVNAQGFTQPIAFEASVQCQMRPNYDALSSARGIYQWMAEGWRQAGISPD